MFKQILPAYAIRNIWRTVRRISMLILGLKGLRWEFDGQHVSNRIQPENKAKNGDSISSENFLQ